MFATRVRLVLWERAGNGALGLMREYLPPPCRRYSRGHFERKPERLDRIGMPLAPKGNQGLRQPPPQDRSLVGVGAERRCRLRWHRR